MTIDGYLQRAWVPDIIFQQQPKHYITKKHMPETNVYFATSCYYSDWSEFGPVEISHFMNTLYLGTLSCQNNKKEKIHVQSDCLPDNIYLESIAIIHFMYTRRSKMRAESYKTAKHGIMVHYTKIHQYDNYMVILWHIKFYSIETSFGTRSDQIHHIPLAMAMLKNLCWSTLYKRVIEFFSGQWFLAGGRG